jgi:hypothetical protein
MGCPPEEGLALRMPIFLSLPISFLLALASPVGARGFRGLDASTADTQPIEPASKVALAAPVESDEPSWWERLWGEGR